MASTETGESSRATSNRNSIGASLSTAADSYDNDSSRRSQNDEHSLAFSGAISGKGSHRSRHSKNNGGFLLSNALFAPPEAERTTPDIHTAQPSKVQAHGSRIANRKSKGTGSSEKIYSKATSKLQIGKGTSPLAAPAATPNSLEDDGTGPCIGGDVSEDGVEATMDKGRRIIDAPLLDVDSAQIINLALNLSETRRIASRRTVSTPLSPVPSADNFNGVGARHHLQQQRRSSRNLSPRGPDRVDRALSPRLMSAPRTSSPLLPAIQMHEEGEYRYTFSASTLARAQKAKTAIELMAQYRRLLLYVPPLKPLGLEQSSEGLSNTGTGSPTSNSFPLSRIASDTLPSRQLGRPYNPLQYIRNRKVRLRERKTIDGEALGFGDVDKVTTWVDRASAESMKESSIHADCVVLPRFSETAETVLSPNGSPQILQTKTTTARARRPRLEWTLTTTDMLAEVYWLEQNDHKRLIEDRHGNKIFPNNVELNHPTAAEIYTHGRIQSNLHAHAEHDMHIETDLPHFRSVKSNLTSHSDGNRGRVRRMMHENSRLYRGGNGSGRESYVWRGHNRSSSESSISSLGGQQIRKRRDTDESQAVGRDILEKQMLEMLEREARENEWNGTPDIEAQQLVETIEAQKPALREGMYQSDHQSLARTKEGSKAARKESHRRADSIKQVPGSQPASGRASLDVPRRHPRTSLEGLDDTAPSSPRAQESKISNAFVPSISIDLSPPSSRPGSPTRKPLERIRSKIDIYRERSRERAHRDGGDYTPTASPRRSLEVSSSPDRRRRSISPTKKLFARKSDDNSTQGVKGSSSPKPKEDESSGLRGLFKSGRLDEIVRGPVSRVGEMLWKRDGAAALEPSQELSSDGSDEVDKPSRRLTDRLSLENLGFSNNETQDDVSPPKSLGVKSYLNDMPTFTSPFDRRGRVGQTPHGGIESPAPGHITAQQDPQDDRRSSRSALLRPPRIDVQDASPLSSPDMHPVRRHSNGSDMSDIESRRGSNGSKVRSSARGAKSGANSILGIPGTFGRGGPLPPPVTGLANLGHDGDQGHPRHWSIGDQDAILHQGPTSRRDIARVRALLLSSGIKAREISRRASALRDIRDSNESNYTDVAALVGDSSSLVPVPKAQEHILAARILTQDIQMSSHLWQASAGRFSTHTVNDLLDRVSDLQARISEKLTPMTRASADEADAVSAELMGTRMAAVKRLVDSMETMLRRRRRRFRWLRRGGWVAVEWVLVGVMWWVWLIVVAIRTVLGGGGAAIRAARWLLWL